MELEKLIISSHFCLRRNVLDRGTYLSEFCFEEQQMGWHWRLSKRCFSSMTITFYMIFEAWKINHFQISFSKRIVLDRGTYLSEICYDEQQMIWHWPLSKRCFSCMIRSFYLILWAWKMIIFKWRLFETHSSWYRKLSLWIFHS